MTELTITFSNESDSSGSFVVFQKAPDDAYSLAWMTEPAAPGSEVTFDWNTDYSFVWADTGVLSPRTNFSASETVPADPSGTNAVRFAQEGSKTPGFAEPRNSGRAGSLTVEQHADIARNQTAVGVGMNGAGIFACQAEPNRTASFDLKPNYWVIFGDYKTGDVLDTEDIHAGVEVTFENGQTSRSAVLTRDKVITVT